MRWFSNRSQITPLPAYNPDVPKETGQTGGFQAGHFEANSPSLPSKSEGSKRGLIRKALHKGAQHGFGLSSYSIQVPFFSFQTTPKAPNAPNLKRTGERKEYKKEDVLNARTNPIKKGISSVVFGPTRKLGIKSNAVETTAPAEKKNLFARVFTKSSAANFESVNETVKQIHSAFDPTNSPDAVENSVKKLNETFKNEILAIVCADTGVNLDRAKEALEHLSKIDLYDEIKKASDLQNPNIASPSSAGTRPAQDKEIENLAWRIAYYLNETATGFNILSGFISDQKAAKERAQAEIDKNKTEEAIADKPLGNKSEIPNTNPTQEQQAPRPTSLANATVIVSQEIKIDEEQLPEFFIPSEAQTKERTDVLLRAFLTSGKAIMDAHKVKAHKSSYQRLTEILNPNKVRDADEISELLAPSELINLSNNVDIENELNQEYKNLAYIPFKAIQGVAQEIKDPYSDVKNSNQPFPHRWAIGAINRKIMTLNKHWDISQDIHKLAYEHIERAYKKEPFLKEVWGARNVGKSCSVLRRRLNPFRDKSPIKKLFDQAQGQQAFAKTSLDVGASENRSLKNALGILSNFMEEKLFKRLGEKNKKNFFPVELENFNDKKSLITDLTRFHITNWWAQPARFSFLNTGEEIDFFSKKEIIYDLKEQISVDFNGVQSGLNDVFKNLLFPKINTTSQEGSKTTQAPPSGPSFKDISTQDMKDLGAIPVFKASFEKYIEGLCKQENTIEKKIPEWKISLKEAIEKIPAKEGESATEVLLRNEELFKVHSVAILTNFFSENVLLKELTDSKSGKPIWLDELLTNKVSSNELHITNQDPADKTSLINETDNKTSTFKKSPFQVIKEMFGEEIQAKLQNLQELHVEIETQFDDLNKDISVDLVETLAAQSQLNKNQEQRVKNELHKAKTQQRRYPQIGEDFSNENLSDFFPDLSNDFELGSVLTASDTASGGFALGGFASTIAPAAFNQASLAPLISGTLREGEELSIGISTPAASLAISKVVTDFESLGLGVAEPVNPATLGGAVSASRTKRKITGSVIRVPRTSANGVGFDDKNIAKLNKIIQNIFSKTLEKSPVNVMNFRNKRTYRPEETILNDLLADPEFDHVAFNSVEFSEEKAHSLSITPSTGVLSHSPLRAIGRIAATFQSTRQTREFKEEGFVFVERDARFINHNLQLNATAGAGQNGSFDQTDVASVGGIGQNLLGATANVWKAGGGWYKTLFGLNGIVLPISYLVFEHANFASFHERVEPRHYAWAKSRAQDRFPAAFQHGIAEYQDKAIHNRYSRYKNFLDVWSNNEINQVQYFSEYFELKADAANKMNYYRDMAKMLGNSPKPEVRKQAKELAMASRAIADNIQSWRETFLLASSATGTTYIFGPDFIISVTSTGQVRELKHNGFV